MDGDNVERSKRNELVAFLFLTIAVAPVLSVMIVGAFGLVIWLSQLILGPPGAL